MNQFDNNIKIESPVTALYKYLKIYEPKDLKLQNIARKLNIELVYSSHRPYAFVEPHFTILNLCENIHEHQQRRNFFDLLFYIFKHESYQKDDIDNILKEITEMKVEQFINYASIPPHMLKYLDFTKIFLIENMSKTFHVPEKHCAHIMKAINENMMIS